MVDPRTSRRGTVGGADRRHVVHRRRRPARPARHRAAGPATSSPARSTGHCTTGSSPCPTPPGVFPAHGAGSACGKHMSAAVESTIGEQRATNYALRPMSEDDFVAVVTEGQPVAPLYFTFAADANRRARDLLDDTETPPLLDSDGLERCMPRRRGHHRRSRSRSVRLRTSAGFDQRAARWPLRRIRRRHRSPRRADRDRRRTGSRDRGQSPFGPHRFRPRPRCGHRRRTHPGANTPSSARLRHACRSAEFAAWRMSDGTDLQIVDVRNPAEHDVGVIDGAITIPLPTTPRRTRSSRTGPLHHRLLRQRRAVHRSPRRCCGPKASPTSADILGGYDAWHTTEPHHLTDAPEGQRRARQIGGAHTKQSRA